LRSALPWCDGARHLIRKAFDKQRVPGIDIVVVQNDLWIRTPRLAERMSKSLALEEIEIDSNRKHEHFLCVAGVERQRIDRRQRHHRPEPENLFRRFRDRAGLLRGFAPCGVTGIEIGSEEECRTQCSFPPILPCLVMLASTSTIARTATSAVMSEMS